MTLAEVKELLEAEQKKRELTTEQNYALAHALKFAKLDAKKSRKLVEALMKIDPLSEAHACKLTDIMPRYPDEVRTLFAKERFVLDPDMIEGILEIIRKSE